MFELLDILLDTFLGSNETYQKVSGKVQETVGKAADYAYSEQEKKEKTKARMANKTDKQLENIAKDTSYDSADRRAALDEYKSRHNK